MNTNLLRYFAVVTAIGMCAVAHAQSTPYQAPAKWSQFNNPRAQATFRTISLPLPDDAAAAASAGKATANSAAGQQLPIPAYVPADKPLDLDGSVAPTPMPEPMADSAHVSAAVGCGSCDSTSCDGGLCGPRFGAISPWFAGADILWLTLANNDGRRLVYSDGTGVTYLSTSDLGDMSATGFDTHFGRYIGCGAYGLDVGYFYLNPSHNAAIRAPGAAGAWRAAMPAWDDVLVNPGGGADTVYNFFDLSAAAYRVERDLFFQGIEANLVGFGLMGARRMGICGPCGLMGNYGHCGAYGGACGPMARGCSGCLQISALQGFRWFQLEDKFGMAANINGTPGYQADDLYYNVSTENNLFGYQIGSRVTYCVCPRLNIGLGGKFGLYGNHARYHQRIGTRTNLAYITTGGVDDVNTSDSKAFVSTLGELDLGLGFRISNAWTIRGGYRLLSACGVATAPGSIATDYSTLAASRGVRADDCIILHGGYVGLHFNW